MKKMIVLVGLMSLFSMTAESAQRIPITGVLPMNNMYASFELLNTKYDQIVLDCQSFVHGVNFYNDKKKVREIRMVNYGECESVYDFISESRDKKKPVCMEIEDEGNVLNLSNDEALECQ